MRKKVCQYCIAFHHQTADLEIVPKMEAKLAEFRKTHAQKKPLFNWHAITSRFSSTQSSQKQLQEEEEAAAEEEPVRDWKIIVLKVLVWLTLFVIFVRLEFGAIYFIISLLYVIYCNLGSDRRRHQLSAYSVFNPNFEKLQGTFSADDYDRQLRRGGSPFFSSSS